MIRSLVERFILGFMAPPGPSIAPAEPMRASMPLPRSSSNPAY